MEEIYGWRYIEVLKKDIEEMFPVGIENNAKEMGLCPVSEALQRRYPGSLDHTSGREVRVIPSISSANGRAGNPFNVDHQRTQRTISFGSCANVF